MISLRSARQSKRVPQIEMAPFLDVVFTLLLFFGVSSTLISTQKSIGITLPESKSATLADDGLIIKVIDTETVEMNGSSLPISDLSQAIQSALLAKPDVAIVLQAAQETPYQTVITVIDAIRDSGSTKLLLDTQRINDHATSHLSE